MQLQQLPPHHPMRVAGEVAGVPHGADLVLPSGVRLQRQRIGAAVVSDHQLRDAVRGVLKLPMPHQRLLASLGFPIELVPVTQLEPIPGSVDPMVAATRISGPEGTARPERVRIATFQGVLGTKVEDAVQHEIGHVLHVLTRQDLSELAAETYAERY